MELTVVNTGWYTSSTLSVHVANVLLQTGVGYAACTGWNWSVGVLARLKGGGVD
jgi:hypothetical protein